MHEAKAHDPGWEGRWHATGTLGRYRYCALCWASPTHGAANADWEMHTTQHATHLRHGMLHLAGLTFDSRNDWVLLSRTKTWED